MLLCTFSDIRALTDAFMKGLRDKTSLSSFHLILMENGAINPSPPNILVVCCFMYFCLPPDLEFGCSRDKM